MRYQDLVVWQKAMELAELVFRLTARLPRDERFWLATQMRRSARSVAANVAEGYGRGCTGDYRRHLAIATGSLCELETDLTLGERLGIFEKEAAGVVRSRVTEVARLLWALRRSLKPRKP